MNFASTSRFRGLFCFVKQKQGHGILRSIAGGWPSERKDLLGFPPLPNRTYPLVMTNIARKSPFFMGKNHTLNYVYRDSCSIANYLTLPEGKAFSQKRSVASPLWGISEGMTLSAGWNLCRQSAHLIPLQKRGLARGCPQTIARLLHIAPMSLWFLLVFYLSFSWDYNSSITGGGTTLYMKLLWFPPFGWCFITAFGW